MKHIPANYLFFCLLFSCLVACKKGGEPEVRDQAPPVGNVEDVDVYPGKNRVRLSFRVEDERVARCVVYWDNKNNVLEITGKELEQGTVSVIIDDLPEGDHVFQILTYDREDVPATYTRQVQARVYGDEYLLSLQNRAIADVVFIEGEDPVIRWAESQADEVGLLITYQGPDPEPRKLYVDASESEAALPGYQPATDLVLQSLFLPETGAIDTFRVSSYTLPAPSRYASIAAKKIIENSGLVTSVISQSSRQLHDAVMETTLAYTNKENQPVTAFIVGIDLGNEQVSLEPLVAENWKNNGYETVSEMAQKQDQPGKEVIAAFNGDFIHVWASDVPTPLKGKPQGIVYKNGIAEKPDAEYCANCTFLGVYRSGEAVIGGSNWQGGLFAVTMDQLQGAVGGYHLLMRNGQPVQQGDLSVHPRTAVGLVNSRFVYFFVVDGRRTGYSAGIGFSGLQSMMQALEVTDGINLDGGGSTTYVSRSSGEEHLTVTNKPSDDAERAVANGWMVRGWE